MHPMLIFIVFLVLLVLAIHFLLLNRTSKYSQNLPPGSFGLPFLGETLDFMRVHKEGKPESFVFMRMKKYNSSKVFKTALLGEKMAVIIGPQGNKFLYSNENKLVQVWWPVTIQRLLGKCLVTTVGDEGKKLRRIIFSCLGPDAVVKCIKAMDQVTQQHLRSHWQGRKEVKVQSTISFFTFELSCRLLMSIEEKDLLWKLFHQFNLFVKGILSFPINIPGTTFYRGMRAITVMRKELKKILKERKVALEQKAASSSQDLLSHLLMTADEDGRFISEAEVINSILNVIFAAYDTTSTALTVLVKYLAEMPDVYDKVLNEQMNIAKQKEAGESLRWEDIQNMRYSWNVGSEVLRLYPPVSGAYRQALVDITYEGYTIPKGWKIFWSASATHRDPSLFPRPETFDESRFDSGGPAPFSFVPFGGGPRMCLGKEFARPVMLIFLHHVVKMFKWEMLYPNEKIIYDPMPVPVEGLPIRLQPRNSAEPVTTE